MRSPPDLTQRPYENAILFSYLQHHLSTSNSQEKARINEFVYRWVADLSAFSEMLVSVRLGRPQATPADRREVVKTAHREEWAFIANPQKNTFEAPRQTYMP
jgi:hypothetical protein